MILLSITLPIETTSEERMYARNLFETQFCRQIASHTQGSPALAYTVEFELPSGFTFTNEQLDYVKDKSPTIRTRKHREPKTDTLRAIAIPVEEQN